MIASSHQLMVAAGSAVMTMLMTASAAAQRVPSSSAPPHPTGRTEILFLGTAGGPPLRVERSEPATLLIVDGHLYLFDCGIGTMQRLQRAGIQSDEVKTIFFTHLHADHDLGIADVMANDFFRMNQASSSSSVDIYGPPQTRELVDAAFRYVTMGFTAFAAEPGAIRAGMVNGEFKSPFVAHEIPSAGLVYQDDEIRVTAAENSHYAFMLPPARQQMKSYSYRVETRHGVVVFTGDTGPSEAVVDLARGADVLVAEVEDTAQVTRFVNGMAAQNHWPPERASALMAHMRQEHLGQEEVGDMASRAQVKSVVLYHYTPANPAAYLSKVKEHFSGPVFAPADLDRYCLESDSRNSSRNAPMLEACPERPVGK